MSHPLCKVKTDKNKHLTISPQYSPNIQSSLPIGWNREGEGHRFLKTGKRVGWGFLFNKYLKTFNSRQKASLYIYNTCIYTYMHVCICTCTDVFVTMLECGVKSRLVTPCLQRLLVRCTWRERTISFSSHHNKTVIYIFSGYIQEEAGSPPTGLQSSSSSSSLYWSF